MIIFTIPVVNKFPIKSQSIGNEMYTEKILEKTIRVNLS